MLNLANLTPDSADYQQVQKKIKPLGLWLALLCRVYDPAYGTNTWRWITVRCLLQDTLPFQGLMHAVSANVLMPARGYCRRVDGFEVATSSEAKRNRITLLRSYR